MFVDGFANRDENYSYVGTWAKCNLHGPWADRNIARWQKHINNKYKFVKRQSSQNNTVNDRWVATLTVVEYI